MKKDIFITKCLLLLIVLILSLVIVSAADTEYPQFSNYWDNNGTQIGIGTAYLNVTVTSTNGIVILQTRGMGFIASNSSGDSIVFNVTIEFFPAGNYPYNWIAYGNGTDGLLNFSNNQSYTVNETPDTIPPHFTSLDNQILLGGQSLNYDINAVDSSAGLGSFAINWTNTFSIVSSTGVLTNVSALSTGDYYINVSVNDTLGNLNSTILLVSVAADTTHPIVILVSPSDSSSRTLSSTATFTYSVTDNNNIATCSLIIGGIIDQTTTTVTKSVSQTFIKSMSNANYRWSVNCTDVANNLGNSSTYSLTVNYTAPSSTPPASEENLTTPPENTAPTDQTNNTNYTAPDNLGNPITFVGTISSWINKIGSLIKPVIEKVKSYWGVSKSYLLWIFTSIGIIILLIIVILKLRVALKKIRGRKIHKKEKKPKDVKENEEIEKPVIKPQVEKRIVKPNKIIESKYGEDAEIEEPIIKPKIEKRIIKPERVVEREVIKPERIIEKRIIKPVRFMGKRSKEDVEVERLRRKIIKIERAQRIRVLEEMRKQVRNNRR